MNVLKTICVILGIIFLVITVAAFLATLLIIPLNVFGCTLFAEKEIEFAAAFFCCALVGGILGGLMMLAQSQIEWVDREERYTAKIHRLEERLAKERRIRK